MRETGIPVNGGKEIDSKKVYMAALAVYVVFFIAFVAGYIMLKDGDSLAAGMSAFALLFLMISAGFAYYILVYLPKRREPEDVSDEAWEQR